MKSKLLKYLAIAKAWANFSKDSTKVGAIIIDEDGKEISAGYNGLIRGADEEILGGYEKPGKYPVIIHAEMNALLHADSSVKNTTLVCTHEPCSDCLKHIMQAGIKKVYYGQEWNSEPELSKEAKSRLLKAHPITFEKIDS